ncbi:phage tail protein [Dellaglioa algida]|uniref:Phage tail tape measure protein n=1 Tax=Dellaglioa algida TaxID=105612 RepID=A0A5C6M6F4_9LACO|nr:phage tail protein [Dellaglioa algida]MDK1720230.1 phage tail protein [Dellaglioa algida]MDK1723620.1 phage tail protein [Dellaglioa algida]TWW10256.1 hypothetical protein LABALGLTS371_15440 [Dellaglioa algida]
MDLETLQVVFDANTEQLQASMNKILPIIESVTNKIERTTGISMNKTEDNLDMSKPVAKMQAQYEKMTDQATKSLEKLEKITDQSTNRTTSNLSKGYEQARSKVSKNVDAMVREIESKMKQAQAKQAKIANLTTQGKTPAIAGNPVKSSKLDDQIAGSQAQMTRYQNQAKALAQSMQSEFDAVPSSLNKISVAMEQNEAQINAMKARLKGLNEDYKNQTKPVGSFQDGFKNKDTDASIKTQDTIQKQSAKMNKLISENDRLGDSYGRISDRSVQLKSALSGINTELSESTIRAHSTSRALNSVGNSGKDNSGIFGKFGSVFNRQSKGIESGTKRMSRGMGGFGGTMKALWSQLIIFTLLSQAITALATGLGKAMMTNDQFRNSLNQIQVNLLTAFYPIYTAIMPALNALMQGLATATGYLAAFISSIFGTTYGAAKQGAAGLYQNVQALDDTSVATDNATKANKKMGNTADKTKKKVKELQRVLMGFDEINRIGLDKDDGADDLAGDTSNPSVGKGKTPATKVPGLDFSGPDYQVPKWLDNFAKQFKKVMSELFAPMKAAWDKYGQRVIDAWKYALREVGGLIEAIGKSFMKVWTNGTGERFIGNLLILFADMLNIIGDIAKAFKDAWNDDGRGTALIQSIFDMFNAILETLHKVATSFREAWNDGTGEKIAANLLEIFTNIFTTIGNLANQFGKAWEAGGNGQGIFSAILNIVNDILTHINNMTKATADWAKTLDFTPLLSSIKNLLKSIEPLSNNIGAGLEWFYKNVLLPLASYTIEDLIPAFLDLLSGAIDTINSVINFLKPLGDWFWNNFLQPIASWTGGVIVSVLEGVANALKGISDWIDNHQKAFEVIVTIIGSFAAAWGLVSAAVVITSAAVVVWNGVAFIATGVTTAFGAAIAFLTSPIGIAIAIIGAIIAAGVLLYQNWDTIKEKAGQLGEWIGKKWDDIKGATSDAWDSVKDTCSKTWDDMKDGASEKFGNMKSSVSSAWDDTKKKTSSTWNDMKTTVSEKSSKIKDDTSNKFREMKDSVGTHFNTIKSDAKNKFDSVASSVSSGSSRAKDKAVDSFYTMKSRIGNYMSDVKSNAKDGFNKVSDWAGNIGSKMGAGLSSGASAVKRGARHIANGIVGVIGAAVNGTIKGINWILSKVGSGNRLSRWSVPRFAKGGRHKGGLALVNDAKSSNWQEMYKLPNGKTGMFPRQRNMVLDLPAGTQVLDGNRTAKMQNEGLVPHYAGGIFGDDFLSGFGDIFGGAGDFIGGAIDSVKDFTKGVWKYISNPSALLDLAIDKFTDFAGAMEPASSIIGGSIKLVKNSAVQWVRDLLNDTAPKKKKKKTHKNDGGGLFDDFGSMFSNMFSGFANGGIVNKDGLYHLAEGNNDEMILPLTNKARAMDLIGQAVDYMGADFSSLQLPDALTPQGMSNMSFSGGSNDSSSQSGGLNENTSAMLGALLTAIENKGNGSNSPVEVTMEIDGRELGRSTITEINKETRRTGVVPLVL